MMRRVIDNVICGATWAAAVISGWFLMAGVRYYRDIPQGFPYYAAERLDDLRLKGIIWIIVAAVMFLLIPSACADTTYHLWKGRKETPHN